MEPNQLALFVLIVLGAVAVLAAVLIGFRKAKEAKWTTTFLGMLGFGMIGVGGFGPGFLADYTELIKALASADPLEQKTAYENAMKGIASGKMHPAYRNLVASYMLHNPIPDLDKLIDNGVKRAKGDDKEFLRRTKDELIRKRKTAESAAKSLPATSPTGRTGAIKHLDSTALKFLKHKPEQELRALRIDPKVLRETLKKRRVTVTGG